MIERGLIKGNIFWGCCGVGRLMVWVWVISCCGFWESCIGMRFGSGVCCFWVMIGIVVFVEV